MKYLSLFSGIGGFELGIQQAYETKRDSYVQEKRGGKKTSQVKLQKVKEGLHSVSRKTTLSTSNGDNELSNPSTNKRQPTCIGYSEIDKYATSIYQHHFPNHKNYGDITKINAEELPDFDFLCGGFPCQSFSIAGKRGGFNDTRGTLFFDIARILKIKQPRLLLLENVKGLLSHDEGRTFATIISTLTELGYDLQWHVLNSKNFGVPQNRERVFIIGHLRGTSRPKVFPFGSDGKISNREDGGLQREVQAEGSEDGQDSGYPDSEIPQDGSDRHLHQIIGGSQGERVYDPKGLATTIASQAGGLGAKTGLYMVDDPSRKTGVVDKNIAPTLRSETHGNLPVIIQKIGNNKESEDYVERELVGSLKSSNQTNPRSGGTSLIAIDPYNNKEIDPKTATTLRTNYQNGNTWVAPKIKDSVEIDSLTKQGLKNILEVYANASKTNANSILSLLRQEIREKEASKWGLRSVISLYSEKVLQSNLYGERFRSTTHQKQTMGNNSLSRSENDTSGNLWTVWEKECKRCASQGWKPHEQQLEQFDKDLQRMPQQTTSRTQELRTLWKTTEGSELLQQALHSIQEIWKSSLHQVRIRRLSPTECARLQGFPDNWADYGVNEKGERVIISDTQKYKVFGNAVTVNVITEIIKRLI
jgi:DNA (cytosine-5)-methyltransferase 1